MKNNPTLKSITVIALSSLWCGILTASFFGTFSLTPYVLLAAAVGAVTALGYEILNRPRQNHFDPQHSQPVALHPSPQPTVSIPRRRPAVATAPVEPVAEPSKPPKLSLPDRLIAIFENPTLFQKIESMIISAPWNQSRWGQLVPEADLDRILDEIENEKNNPPAFKDVTIFDAPCKVDGFVLFEVIKRVLMRINFLIDDKYVDKVANYNHMTFDDHLIIFKPELQDVLITFCHLCLDRGSNLKFNDKFIASEVAVVIFASDYLTHDAGRRAFVESFLMSLLEKMPPRIIVE